MQDNPTVANTVWLAIEEVNSGVNYNNGLLGVGPLANDPTTGKPYTHLVQEANATVAAAVKLANGMGSISQLSNYFTNVTNLVGADNKLAADVIALQTAIANEGNFVPDNTTLTVIDGKAAVMPNLFAKTSDVYTKQAVDTKLSAKADISVLSNYVKNDALITTLADYVKNADLNTELSNKQDKLTAGANITIDNDNKISASQPDLSDYVKTSALHTALATKADISALADYVKQSELSKYLTVANATTTYATKSSLGDITQIYNYHSGDNLVAKANDLNARLSNAGYPATSQLDNNLVSHFNDLNNRVKSLLLKPTIYYCGSWVKNEDTTIYAYTPGKGAPTQTAMSFSPKDMVMGIDNKIYTISDDGLYQYDPKVTPPTQPILSIYNPNTLVLGKDQAIYVLDGTNSIWKYEPGKPVPTKQFLLSTIFDSASVSAFGVASNGDVYIGLKSDIPEKYGL